MPSLSYAKPPIPALTSARFLPAVQVMTYHMVQGYTGMFHKLAENPELREAKPDLYGWLQSGAEMFNGHWVIHELFHGSIILVSFFFPLSGFILVYNYMNQDLQMQVENREFFVNRFARIYPAYLLGLIFALPWFRAMRSDPNASPITVSNWGTALLALFLVQAWFPQTALVWNPPAWSLSCEAFFYVLFPWLARQVNRMGRTALWVGVALCFVASIGPSMAYVALDPDGLESRTGVWGGITWMSDGWWQYVMKYNPVIRFPEFFMGMLVGKLYCMRIRRDEATEHRYGAMMSVGAVLGIVLVCLFTSRIPYLVMHNGLMAPLYLLMIFGLSLGGGPIHKLLSWKKMVQWGDATYAYYILHMSILVIALVVAHEAPTRSIGAPWYLALTVLSTVGISVLAFDKFETPLRRKIRRWFNPPPAAGAPAA